MNSVAQVLAEQATFQLLPALTEAEYTALKDDIRAHGVLVPIEVDEQGNILDGHHRVRAWAELRAEGVALDDYMSLTRIGMSDAEKRAHAIRLNINRRHLNRDQRAKLIETLASFANIDGSAMYTTDEIGEMIGVSDETVRQTVSKNLETDRPLLVRGKDGKNYPAKKPRTVVNKNRKEQARAQTALDLLGDDAPEGVSDLRDIERELKEHKREDAREQNRALTEQTPPATIFTLDATYQTIVLDPPWDWGDEGDADQFGRARPTYATMSIDEIAELPVLDLAEKNAHIYLWITNRSLPKGFGLLQAWGFRYVTALTWCKPHFGMGNYYRGQTEHVLFGVRGSLPILRNNVGTWFQAPRGERHSSKPDAFYQLVESCSPGPWLEMFAREPRKGWVSWGAEVCTTLQ